MDKITVVETDFDNKGHCRDFLILMKEYARDPFGIEEMLPDNAEKEIINKLKKMPSVVSFLVYAGHQPVALSNCFVSLSTLDAREFINIHDFFVRREVRGQGIGLKLLEAIQKKAKQLKCCRLTLEVRDDNYAAIDLYERFGFDEGDPPLLYMTKEFY